MERRTASHTEEEEMNQRRRLLNLARKGDQKAIGKLFEMYQVRVYSGDAWSRKEQGSSGSTSHAKARAQEGTLKGKKPHGKMNPVKKSAKKSVTASRKKARPSRSASSRKKK
ncbi:MAG: hypothetical protein ACREI3_07920 [Nitrospirales bacterium]